MAKVGRMEAPRQPGNGLCFLAETAMGRWRRLIGPKLRARTLPGGQGEVALAVSVLNHMSRAATPVFTRAG